MHCSICGLGVVIMQEKRIVRMLLRVSSNQQLEADGDLSVQRRIVEDYIAGHPDWILDGKEYFEGIKDILQLYYYIFTEKLSCETGYYSNESDMHIIIKDGRIRKVCKNNGQKGMGEPKTYKKCVKCSIYKANEEHEIAIEKAWHHFDEYFD